MGDIVNGCCDSVETTPGGVSAGKASKITATTTPTAIPAIANRVSVTILNNDAIGSGVMVWVGFTAIEATDAGGGFPVRPQGGIAMDYDASVDIYVSCDSGTVELRLMEAGN